MKTKLEVLEIIKLSNNILFTVKFNDGKYLIGDNYENYENKFKFKLKGIGMENHPESETKSILVEIISNEIELADFKDKIFTKED